MKLPANYANYANGARVFPSVGASFASFRVFRGPSIPSSNGSPDQAAAQAQHGESDHGRGRCGAIGDERDNDEPKDDRCDQGRTEPPAEPSADDFQCEL